MSKKGRLSPPKKVKEPWLRKTIMNFTRRKKRKKQTKKTPPSNPCLEFFKDEAKTVALQLVVAVLEEMEISVHLLSVTRDLYSDVVHSK